MIGGFAHTLAAFAKARYLAATLRSRAAIARHHDRQLSRLIAQSLPRFPFYRAHLAGGFAGLPVMDKAALMANFAGCNLGGFSADVVRQSLAEGRDGADGFQFGQSTGTSGNRGYYVISERERFVWLGTILAKTLPDALWRSHRVAIALPGMSSLYRSASSGSRIRLAFYDTAEGMAAWEDALAGFAPDTIVASPKVLRHLAERGKLPAQAIFSGAEVLDPLDRAAIEGATGQIVREIYMATEGLFGVSCPHGALHLAEDVVHFEWEDARGDGALKVPIVTDFTRTAQAMVRYRMNDLLELSDEPCACGSAFQRVKAVHGRADDIFLLVGTNGALVTVTPDVVRNAIVDAHPGIADFRAVQTGPAAITITLAQADGEMANLARAALAQRLARLGISAEITLGDGLAVPFDGKLRRVRREWSPS
jgi:putative adenylate-forming enzyme